MVRRTKASLDGGEVLDYYSADKTFEDFCNAYCNWVDDIFLEEKSCSCCVIEGMGLLGKTAFIEREIVPYFTDGNARSESPGFPDRTPIVVKCNYDAFDNAPSKLDVLITLRNQLVRQGVRTPRFDYGLRAYCEAIDIAGWEKRLKADANPSDVLKQIDESSNLLDVILPKASGIYKLIKGIFAVRNVLSTLRQAAETMSVKKCIDGAMAGEILALADGLLLEDIRLALLQSSSPSSSNSVKTSIAICVIFDAIERSAAGDFWEEGFAKCPWCFTVLSGRSLPKDKLKDKHGQNTYTMLDLSQDSEDISQNILKKVELSSGLIEACEGVPGLVKIIAATAGMGDCAKTEIVHYLSKRLGKGFSGWTEERDLSATLSDILAIQMKHLPSDQVQVLYVMAWFGPASPRWLCAQLPSMLQPHSRAMSELGDLPYVFEEGDRWRIHALVAHCLRYLCDGLTMDVAIDNLVPKLPAEPMMHLTEDQLEIAEAVVRLQAGRLAAELRGLADGNALADLWDITVGDAGGLRKWTELVLDVLSKMEPSDDARAEGVVVEFNDLLMRVLRWNEGHRGRSDDLEINSERACCVAKAYKELCETDVFGRLSERIRSSIMGAQVSALLRCGAVLSDQSRGCSDPEPHHHAFECEIEALSLVLDEIEKASPSAAKGEPLVLLANCLNAVAVSTYRLRGYEFAIPLFENLYQLFGRLECKVSPAKKGQYLRNYGACLYGYAHDVLSHEAAVVDDAGLDEESAQNMAKRAVYVLREAVKEDPGRAWPARLTEASCRAICGDGAGGGEDGALELLRSVRDDIVSKGQERSEYYSRCCLLLSERYEELKEHSSAYLFAGESYVARREVKGRRHVDTRKSAQRVRELRTRHRYGQLPWEMTVGDLELYPFLRLASSSDAVDLWSDDEAVLAARGDVNLYADGLQDSEACLLNKVVGRLQGMLGE